MPIGILPHVTIKAQPGLTDRSRWVKALGDRLRSEPRFSLQLDGVGWFADEIIFLRVHGDGLRPLHNAILDVLERVGVEERFEFDGDAFEPHLTLGAMFAGADLVALRSLAVGAERIALSPFEVDAVVELHRSGKDEPYQSRDRFSLAGGRG